MNWSLGQEALEWPASLYLAIEYDSLFVGEDQCTQRCDTCWWYQEKFWKCILFLLWEGSSSDSNIQCMIPSQTASCTKTSILIVKTNIFIVKSLTMLPNQLKNWANRRTHYRKQYFSYKLQALERRIIREEKGNCGHVLQTEKTCDWNYTSANDKFAFISSSDFIVSSHSLNLYLEEHNAPEPQITLQKRMMVKNGTLVFTPPRCPSTQLKRNTTFWLYTRGNVKREQRRWLLWIGNWESGSWIYWAMIKMVSSIHLLLSVTTATPAFS